jgi:hypothetical protein
MGGVPEHWRTLSGSSETGAGWTAVYNSLDMISPWSVGRYSNNSGADSFKTNNIVPDLAACNNNNKDYMPVIWPGFSWKNLKSNSTPPSIETLNTIPRNGGQFYWRQAYNAVQAGVKFIYVAMFDEVDEGTAMFKITDITAKLPIQANDRLVSLDIDGVNLPSDWYLRLADQSQKMLNGTIPLTRNIPITPPFTLAGNGAEFITQQNSLTIYPNPADSEIYINFSLPEPSDVGISIINYMGQLILQNSDKKKLDSGSHTIKVLVESLSKGVYLVRININNRVFVKKVIIK